MRYFNLHTHHPENNPVVVEMVNQYPNDFRDLPHFSVGIHPWHVESQNLDSEIATLENQIQHANCLAIGECGLDKRSKIQYDLQLDAFERQLNLALKYKKPVIVHCVASFSEVILAKKKMKSDVPMIIHGFAKNAVTAKQLIDNGFYLSFGKFLMKNPELKSVFNSVPDDRIFLETDSMETGIKDVYIRAASYKDISVDAIQNMIKKNVKTVFNVDLFKITPSKAEII